MGCQLEVTTFASYVPANDEWEATVTPVVMQHYPTYGRCHGECGRRYHISEIKRVTDARTMTKAERDRVAAYQRGGGKMPFIGTCHHCEGLVFQREPDTKELERSHYCSADLAGVNSAIETHVWQIQRQVEQAQRALDEAEEQERQRRETPEGEAEDAPSAP